MINRTRLNLCNSELITWCSSQSVIILDVLFSVVFLSVSVHAAHYQKRKNIKQKKIVTVNILYII